MAPIFLNLVLLGADLLVLFGDRRRRAQGRSPAWWPLLSGPVAAGLFQVGWGLWERASIFLLAQSLCWWGFVHLPLVLLVRVLLAWRGGTPAPRVLLPMVGGIVLFGIYAFEVEPRRLEVSVVPIEGLPFRVVLLADIQTDTVGAYEAEVFDAVIAADPDLVLFAGDYIQVTGPRVRAEQEAKLREQVARLHPRLGGYAVRGDVDNTTWEQIFAGTTITPLPETTTLDLGALTLSTLSISDSRNRQLSLPHVEGLHVVLGHAPDFVLGSGRRDLNLAGHVHGGQVQIPGFGPIMTLTRVPRSAAVGLSQWGDDQLYVSRGLGMERNQAPRLRVWCRPELVVLEPAQPRGGPS